MEIQEASAEMRRTVIDKQSGRLADAAGVPVDETLRSAIRDVAAECRPATIDTLAAVLRRLRTTAPDRIGVHSVVAFARYGPDPSTRVHRGVAVTVDNEDRSAVYRFNVHTVYWDEATGRWEGQNGRYRMAWAAAVVELFVRIDGETQP